MRKIKIVLEMFYLFWIMFFEYKLLEYIKASELLWFLYWMFIPLGFIIALLSNSEEEEVVRPKCFGNYKLNPNCLYCSEFIECKIYSEYKEKLKKEA